MVNFTMIKHTLSLNVLAVKHINIYIAMIFFFILFYSGCATSLFSWDRHSTTMKPLTIEGIYECSNGTYKGLTSIKKYGETYRLRWKIGKQEYYGIGIRNGNLLSSSWTNGKGIIGIVVYKIEPGPKIEGKYSSLPGKNIIRTETLTFRKDLSPPSMLNL
jgi:hypothetical protein